MARHSASWRPGPHDSAVASPYGRDREPDGRFVANLGGVTQLVSYKPVHKYRLLLAACTCHTFTELGWRPWRWRWTTAFKTFLVPRDFSLVWQSSFFWL